VATHTPLPLKSAIVARGLTFKKVAEDNGVSPTVLSEVLNRRRVAWPALRERLAGYLGASAAELFGDDDGVDAAAAELVRRTTKAQGLDEIVVDTVVIGKVATLLRAEINERKTSAA
jgi:transcriptional regulator with XRE-family HTH domain